MRIEIPVPQLPGDSTRELPEYNDNPFRVSRGLTGESETLTILCRIKVKDGRLTHIIIGDELDYAVFEQPSRPGELRLCARPIDEKHDFPNWPNPEPIVAE